MAVTYQTEGVKMPDIKKRETTEWIKAVAASYGKRLGEIAYIFCSDEKILEVNRQYLQHDYYTDIITFDYCEGDRLSGDLFISLDTIRTNAEQFGASYDDELHRVIIHGILHLCGINDKGPGEREIMEAAETKALAMRKIVKLIHSFHLKPVKIRLFREALFSIKEDVLLFSPRQIR